MTIDVKNKIDEFENKNIELAPNYTFNQKQTLDLIFLYMNSKFESGEEDPEGFKKYFYNLMIKTVETAAKLADIDVKDFRFIAASGTPEILVWLLEREFKTWTKDTNLGFLLNDITDMTPTYGSHVLKKAKGRWHSVDLRNVIIDPSVGSLEESPFVIFKHIFTPETIARQPWDVPSSLLKEEEIPVFETYYLDGGQWKFFVSGGEKPVPFTDIMDTKPNFHEFHWKRMLGKKRWLGVGEVEKNFDVQMRENELANIKSKGLYWTSLKLYQTRDETVKRNLLTDTKNGDIIRSLSEITPIVNEERNLAAFNQEEQRWDANLEQNSFTFDVVRGQRLPAGTPLGSAQLQTSAATGYFDKRREELSFYIKDWIWNKVIPDFTKDVNKEHSFTLSESEDVERINKFFIKRRTANKTLELIGKGKVPLKDQVDLIRAMETERWNISQRELKIPPKFYDNAKFKMDIVITGERQNLEARLNTLNTALVILGQNPGILRDKTTKKVFFKLLEAGGVNPEEIIAQEPQEGLNETIQNIENRGSIPRPAPQPTGAAKETATV